MVGSEADARAALRGNAEWIGSGERREVYLIEDIVYKVERSLSVKHNRVNQKEFDKANAVRETAPFNIVIPEITLYAVDGETVLAMPFIDGEEMQGCPELDGVACHDSCARCLPADIYAVIEKLDFDGPSTGNTIRKDGKYYLIDLHYDDPHD